MPASFPSSVKSFTTRNAGDTIQPAHVNDLQDEVAAIEAGLLTTGLTSPLPVNAGVKFPAAQAASSDANTLDDYEEGTWTPVLTFATPGNLSVAYSTQLGSYLKLGQLVWTSFHITTSAFTHTTASGLLTITGLPFTSAASLIVFGSMVWNGITKANYTQVNPRLAAGVTSFTLMASGSGQNLSDVVAADTPTGGTMVLFGVIVYRASA